MVGTISSICPNGDPFRTVLTQLRAMLLERYLLWEPRPLDYTTWDCSQWALVFRLKHCRVQVEAAGEKQKEGFSCSCTSFSTEIGLQ